MNQVAKKWAEIWLSHFQIIGIDEKTKLYHGARSDSKIEGLRPNAMFTSGLFRAIDYAFIRDNKDYINNTVVYENRLYRSLFCVRPKKTLRVVETVDFSFLKLCATLNKLDPNIPSNDTWVQDENGLLLCLQGIYGSFDGVIFKSTKNSMLPFDEYIFWNATEMFDVTRRID